MTVNQAIDRLDALYPNAYTREEKIRWLSSLDALIYDCIYATHEDTPDPFTGYTPSDGEKTLFAPEPYDEMYLFFLHSRISFYDGESTRQASSFVMYNELYAAYRNHYNRLHLPKSERRKTV